MDTNKEKHGEPMCSREERVRALLTATGLLLCSIDPTRTMPRVKGQVYTQFDAFAGQGIETQSTVYPTQCPSINKSDLDS